VVTAYGFWQDAIEARVNFSNILPNGRDPVTTLFRGCSAKTDKRALSQFYFVSRKAVGRALELRNSETGFHDLKALKGLEHFERG
jgi:hypothetical protein